MIGNETMGLNKAFKEYCDVLCTIPMDEKSYATSFNVGCAASIMMYEVTRQRKSLAALNESVHCRHLGEDAKMTY